MMVILAIVCMFLVLTQGQNIHAPVADSVRGFQKITITDNSGQPIGYAAFYIKGDKIASIVVNSDPRYTVTKIVIQCDPDNQLYGQGHDTATCVSIPVQSPLFGAPEWSGATMSPESYYQIFNGYASLAITYSPEMNVQRPAIPRFEATRTPDYFSILKEQPQMCTNGVGTAPYNALCAFPFTSNFDGKNYDACSTSGHSVPYCGTVASTWGECMPCAKTIDWGHLFLYFDRDTFTVKTDYDCTFAADLKVVNSGLRPYPYTSDNENKIEPLPDNINGATLKSEVFDELVQGRFLAIMVSSDFFHLVAGPIVPMGLPEIDSVSTTTNLSVELDFYDRGYDNATVAVAFNLPVRDVGNEIWIEFPKSYDLSDAKVVRVMGVANDFLASPHSTDRENHIIKVSWGVGDSQLLYPYANYTVELHSKITSIWQVTVFVDQVGLPNNCDDTTFTVTTRKCFDEDLFEAQRYTIHHCPTGPTDVTITASTPDGHPSGCTVCNACQFLYTSSTGEDVFMCEHNHQTFMRTNVVQPNSPECQVIPN